MLNKELSFYAGQRLLMEQRQTAVLQAQQQQSQEEVGRLRHAAAGREHGLQDQIRQAETKCAHMEQVGYAARRLRIACGVARLVPQ